MTSPTVNLQKSTKNPDLPKSPSPSPGLVLPHIGQPLLTPQSTRPDTTQTVSSSKQKINLNLSPYRDLSPVKRQFKKTTGQVTMVANNPNAPADDPAHFYWLYGFLDYKMHFPEELAMKKVTKQIDRLAEKIQRLNSKGVLVFDIIATQKHILAGAPHRLGRAIYKYVDAYYYTDISTTFVGLTDNTSRRVGRDVFCKNQTLSKTKHEFTKVDDQHMFVIYPTPENRSRDPTVTVPGFAANARNFGTNHFSN
eukprot:TRINITY_DN67687_c10_g8_i1.p1 TRINITY_DN67687_c10_g8~~TRINITY_DN67687_c10_g8_i1.p1  ORF type:complete len:252 (+),score=6.01 TRINITY_DN67687_c10_g8_i1:64-819(+)